MITPFVYDKKKPESCPWDCQTVDPACAGVKGQGLRTRILTLIYTPPICANVYMGNLTHHTLLKN
jgi:hypothetical protein